MNQRRPGCIDDWPELRLRAQLDDLMSEPGVVIEAWLARGLEYVLNGGKVRPCLDDRERLRPW